MSPRKEEESGGVEFAYTAIFFALAHLGALSARIGHMSPQKEKKFGGVEFAYIAIFFALANLGALSAGIMIPKAAAIGIFAWGVVGHIIAITHMVITRNTKAAIVLFAFMGFWISASLSLGNLAPEGLRGLFIVGEVALILFLSVFQSLYQGELRFVLIVILGAVAWLLLSKFVAIPGIATAIMLWVIAIGLLFRTRVRLSQSTDPGH